MNPLFDKTVSSTLPLPRGWREHTRGFDGRVYYSSEYTKETAWERPMLPAPPKGFEVRAHAEYGHYFKNINTGEKQLHHPHDEEGYYEPGEFVCTMHPKTMQLSPLEEVL